MVKPKNYDAYKYSCIKLIIALSKIKYVIYNNIQIQLYRLCKPASNEIGNRLTNLEACINIKN